MILPIYSALEKIDARYIEASRDLGANPAQTFFRTILPMSMPGVISGCTMVFMPALTNFVIPRLLGGGQYTLIGSLIEQQFIVINDWNFGSAAAIILMAFVLLGARCASIGATSARRQK